MNKISSQKHVKIAPEKRSPSAHSLLVRPFTLGLDGRAQRSTWRSVWPLSQRSTATRLAVVRSAAGSAAGLPSLVVRSPSARAEDRKD